VIEPALEKRLSRILEYAVEAGAEYVVSGDSHLLELGEYSSVRIVSPNQVVALL
jgi:predicted nucleic acid-binding protein